MTGSPQLKESPFDAVLGVARQNRSAGVLACGFGRRLAARIQLNDAASQPATAALQEQCQVAPGCKSPRKLSLIFIAFRRFISRRLELAIRKSQIKI